MCELADVCVRMSVYQCMHHSMLVCWHRVGMCNVLKQVTATSLLPGISSAVHTQTHTNPISCLLVFPLKSWCYPSTNMHFSSSLLCHLPCCITGHISFTSVPHSWVYVSVQCISCSHHSHSPELKEVFEKKNTPLFLLFSFFSYLFCLYFSNPPVLSFVLFFFLLLSFFPQITELGPGCLDQCHHSGWQWGWTQRFPGRLHGLCGCLSSFWVFSHWLSPHLSGELTVDKLWEHKMDTYMNQLSKPDIKIQSWTSPLDMLVLHYSRLLFSSVAQMKM